MAAVERYTVICHRIEYPLPVRHVLDKWLGWVRRWEMERMIRDRVLLIARIRSRDPQALIDAYALYGKRVFSLIYRIVDNREAAEEILQDTFLRLWDRFERYDADKGALLSWLFRVARNCALDFLRKESRRGCSNVIFIEEDALDQLERTS